MKKTISLFLSLMATITFANTCDYKLLKVLADSLEITLHTTNGNMGFSRIKGISDVLSKAVEENLEKLQKEGHSITKNIGADLLIVQNATEQSIEINNFGENGKVIIVKISPKDFLTNTSIPEKLAKTTTDTTPSQIEKSTDPTGVRYQERVEKHNKLKEILSILKEKGVIDPNEKAYVKTANPETYAKGMRRNIDKFMDALNLTRKDLSAFILKEEGNANPTPEEIEKQHIQLRGMFKSKSQYIGAIPGKFLEYLKKYAENYQKPAIEIVSPLGKNLPIEEILEEEVAVETKQTKEIDHKNRETYIISTANILGISREELLEKYGDGSIQGLHVGSILEAIRSKMGIAEDVFGLMLGYPHTSSQKNIPCIVARLSSKAWFTKGRLGRIAKEIQKIEEDAQDNFANYAGLTYDNIVKQRNLKLNPLLDIILNSPIPGINPLEVEKLKEDFSRSALSRKIDIFSRYIQNREGEQKNVWLINKMAEILTGDKSKTDVLFQHVTVPASIFHVTQEPGQVEFNKFVELYTQLITSKQDKSPATIKNTEQRKAVITLLEVAALQIAELRSNGNRLMNTTDKDPEFTARIHSVGEMLNTLKAEATLSGLNFEITGVNPKRLEEISNDKTWPTIEEAELIVKAVESIK